MTVTVAVSTPDAQPLLAPYRLSGRSGHTTAVVTIYVTGDGPVRAYRIMRDSYSSITQGVELAAGGGICGLCACGTFAPTALPTPVTLAASIAATDLPTDGAHQIGVYIHNGDEFE